MAIIDIQIEDRAVRRALARGAAAVGRALDMALEEGLDGIIAEIRNNDDSLFTNPSGSLTGGLWRSEAQGGAITGGWSGPSAVYGPSLEHGPKDKGPKPIYPKNVLSKGYGSTGASGRAKRSAGAPILALRIITAGGAVIFRRSSTYVWKASMLRPHWSWALKRKKAWLNATIKRRVIGALKNAMRIR